MANLPDATGPIQWPTMWTEEWLQIAIDELEKLDLTPDERLRYEMTLSVDAVMVRKADRELREAEERARAEAEKRVMVKFVRNDLQAGLSVEVTAELNEVSAEVVQELQRQLNAESDVNA